MEIDLSQAEENYLKAIYSLFVVANKAVSTNKIAEKLNTKASSVTDMVKKLSEKELVNYVKYQGVSLTTEGKNLAVHVIRKHRLWEVFLVRHLGFKWDEVHEVAEQLEHVKSVKLTNGLDAFLDFPKYDPHGDPIPDKEGNFIKRNITILSSLKINEESKIVGVKDSSSAFLKYLDNADIKLGAEIKVIHKENFDNSMMLLIEGQKISISQQISSNLYVKQND
ncbi:metal-dependent transcriptional regulator [Wenyingzhuangia sp. 2_MG-2023]|uniref:metal-dependent transcriptional regulator n=1 Tax=Wenyingzhuangia sp. 2_MG-2023 TaxID=3062639 RepID=UPI0026E2E2F9|nr:metal-dependent transcriptional regulator [Wenyingzhuangia sp. 2_MG-2023]MDO6736481.1 metal-dependent transcriptional regulator [Wenyingzhuangia sp. 2_MG-2023]